MHFAPMKKWRADKVLLDEETFKSAVQILDSLVFSWL